MAGVHPKVTELMVTSLGKAIHGNRTPFTEQQRRDVIVHVARGLSYLHSVGVTHRDLKPDNVMQDEYGTWKLIDFGMVRPPLSFFFHSALYAVLRNICRRHARKHAHTDDTYTCIHAQDTDTHAQIRCIHIFMYTRTCNVGNPGRDTHANLKKLPTFLRVLTYLLLLVAAILLCARVRVLGSVKASTKGSSKKSTQKTGSNQGTQGFMAPELYTEEGGTHKVDIFAFAVTIWELYTLVRAFVDVGDLAIGDMVKAGKRPPLASVAQADVRELITASWQQDPARRPKMADVVAIIESSGSARASFTTPSMDITAPSAPPAPSAKADDNIKQSNAPGPQQQASEAPPAYKPLPSRNVYLAGNLDTAGGAAKLQQEKADLERGWAALEEDAMLAAEQRKVLLERDRLAAEQRQVQLERERLAAEEKRQQQVNAMLAAEQRKVLLERDRLAARRKAAARAEEIKVQESARTPLLMQHSLQQQQIQQQQMQLQQQQWQIQTQTRQPPQQQPQMHQQQRHDGRQVVQPVAQERWFTCWDDHEGHSYCCGLCKTKPQTTCQKIFGALVLILLIVAAIIVTKSSNNSGSSTTLATTLAMDGAK